MRKTSIIISCIALVAIAFSAGCGGSVPVSVSSSVPAPYESAPTGTVVTAEYTELAPRIDGVASELDEAWANAQSTIVKVSDSANTYEVTLKAAFDDENFFLLEIILLCVEFIHSVAGNDTVSIYIGFCELEFLRFILGSRP